MKRLRLEKVAAISAIDRFKPSRPGCWPGSKLWLMKSGVIISSMALRSALARASIKRRARASFFSSSDGTVASSLPGQPAFLYWVVNTVYDATERSLACCPAAYSPECVEGKFCELRPKRLGSRQEERGGHYYCQCEPVVGEHSKAVAGEVAQQQPDGQVPYDRRGERSC